MKRIIKPNHKIRSKRSIFHGRTWAEAISTCIGTKISIWNWQCGINAHNPPRDREYYMWFWKDLKFFTTKIPPELFGYIDKMCAERNFIP